MPPRFRPFTFYHSPFAFSIRSQARLIFLSYGVPAFLIPAFQVPDSPFCNAWSAVFDSCEIYFAPSGLLHYSNQYRWALPNAEIFRPFRACNQFPEFLIPAFLVPSSSK